MSEDSRDDVIGRVRKLLARTGAGSGCTQQESEAAFARASRLIMDHNLRREEIEDETKSGQRDPDSWVEVEIHETGRWSLENNLCCQILQDYFFVKGVLRHRRRKFRRYATIVKNKRTRFLLFGKTENVEVACYIWKALREAFDRHWKTFRVENDRPCKERRLFIHGMAEGFSAKLRDERTVQTVEMDRVTGNQGGTELVLMSIEQRTQAKFEEAYPTCVTGKANFAGLVGERSTRAAGYLVGRSLSLNKSIGYESNP